MAEIEVEGKTVEDAIREGLAKLGCSRDRVRIKILNEGTSGLFGLMGAKPARVLLSTVDAAPSAVAATADFAAAETRAKETVGRLLTLMNVGFSAVTPAAEEDRIVVDIKSDESSLIIGKAGQTLEALEHVVNLILHKDEATRVKVSLDTEDYRRRQEERLESMAQKAAEQVKRTGKAYRFDPMPARERRVIHLFLKDDPDIETFSEGEGPFRKVGVKPKKK